MDDIITAPLMQTVGKGVVVKRPEGEACPPEVGENGGFSVGAGHMPGVGPVIYVAVHSGERETLLMALGIDGFRELATLMNATTARVMSGLYERPETAQ